MSEEGGSRKVRKTGSPKVMKKSEVGGQKSEEENVSALNIPQSDIQNKSETAKALLSTTEKKQTRKIDHPTSEINTMEVHHHPEVEKKGFKEYLLEGLMIFIAVFMGFIAENIRENVVEKKREKEYITEMVNNLKYDTLRCKNNIAADLVVMRGLDSLRDELKKAIAGKVDGNKLYYLTLQYTRTFGRAVFNNSAYTELKSSGSLRLISDKSLVTQMSDYYDRRVTAAQLAQPTQQRDELKKTNELFFSWTYFDDLIKASDKKNSSFKTVYNYQKILAAKPALTLLDTNPKNLNRLYNEIADFETDLKDYIFFLNWVRDGAVPLMDSIKKQYEVSDE